MAIPVTRSQVDSVYTFALLFNTVAGIFSVIVFFLSAWWVFLVLGTVGLPILIPGILIYKYTRFREPMQRYAHKFVVKLYEGLVQRRGTMLRRLYRVVCWLVPNDAWKHINWGYATLTPTGELLPKIEPEDEEKRFYGQLYYYLASGLGNWNTLEGKNVLEVRCGGGGGLGFISKYLLPTKCIGVDVSSTQMDYCKKHLGENPNMKFYATGDLEELSKIGELCDEKIDLVISLQSSKGVKNFSNLVKEIDSILKPGGMFAFSDLRLTEDWNELEKDLEGTSMKIIKKEDITKNVVQALKLDELERWSVMTRRLGSMVRYCMKRAGVVKDNAIAESLIKGNTQAMAYILHKMPQSDIHVH